MQCHNKMLVFQEEIFGYVIAITSVKDEAAALALANDTAYDLGAGIRTSDTTLAHSVGRNVTAGRIWINCYHHYPAPEAFRGNRTYGIGRES
ncbi:aldehyde dehydrogenase family protein, partial [Vibrio cholerae]|uniref:aldehyde dehydrogenase family protein n=1 Tax=Vibrio cholerae TaxID=666 RepID=UPI0039DF7BEA